MKWEREGTWWRASGKNGTFWIKKIYGVYWAWYKPKNKRREWILKSHRISEAKMRCECNFRWEI